MDEAATAAVARTLLTVQVGGERFALPASDVAEVIRPPAVTRVPLGPVSLLGVSNLRGAVMPVVSLGRLLGREDQPSAHARVVVIDRSAPVGILVDRVASLGASGAATPDDSAPTRILDLDALLAHDFGGLTRRGQSRPSAARQDFRARSAADEAEVGLVCFAVAGQEFALPLASVREVIALPDGVAVVPQADAVMLGAVTLREHLLPLVSLRGLLGFRSAAPASGRPRVVVVRIGRGLVGLVIDGMREILRLPSRSIDPVPAILTRGNGEAQVQGICRLDGGRRLVSVLSADRLFRDQAVMEQIMSQTENGQDMEAGIEASALDEQFVVFWLGGEEFGLPIVAVDEVVRVPDTLTRLPKAPAFIEGVINLRGHVVPVIDQRRRFRLEGRGERRRERIVVVRIDRMQAGFVVDAVSEVLSISQDRIRPTPDLAADGSPVIGRIANMESEGRMILLLDPRELLDRAEQDLLADMGEDDAERAVS